jgi:hypothetical protein
MTVFAWIAILLLAAAPRGDPPEGRAIYSLIATLNDPQQRAAAFSRDAEPHIAPENLVWIHLRQPDGPPSVRAVIGVQETWTRMTVPRIVAGPILLLTPSAAVVDGASRVDGAIWMRRNVPLRFVLRKEDAGWRIVSMRVVE